MRQIGDEFETFWQAYPIRIARGAAKMAFAKALRKTTLETILAAIESYKRHKPEDRAWCHASTWLNQERWADEWEPITIKPEPMFRALRDLAEARAYCLQHKPECLKYVNTARSIDDLPVFMRNVPKDWTANVIAMRKTS